MPYIVEGKADAGAAPSGEGPVLILIHGTGATADIDLGADAGDRWWQPGSDFDRWLCAKIERQTGGSLGSDAVFRFVWSGLNSEEAREKAATALLAAIRPLEAAGRSISIIAHSHGGNVARRACEMAVLGGVPPPASPWSVVCIGTPFFHYGLFAGLLGAVFRLAALLLWAAAFYWAPPWLAVKIPDLGIDWYRIILGAVVLNYLIIFLSGCLELDPRRYLARQRFRGRALFTNLYSCRDEALALLQSLNRPVRVMRHQEAERWIGGPLGCAFIAVFLLCAAATLLVLLGNLAGVAEPGDLLDMVGLLFLLVVGAVAVSFLYEFRNFLLDLAITARLRVLAYGNDRGAPMTAVEPYPWPGAQETAVRLPTEMEEVAEAYIAERTGALWTKLRSAMAPNTTLLNQDVRTVVERALTGDELAHTVYYRIEPFADLVAALLQRSGHWRLAPGTTTVAAAETS